MASDRVDYRSVTQAELGHILGITPATLNKWVAQGCPVKVLRKNGKRNVKTYDPKKVFKWRIEKENKDVTESFEEKVSGESNRNLKPDDQLKLAKLAREEFLLEKEKNLYVLKSRHIATLKHVGGIFKRFLLALSKKVAVKVVRMKKAEDVVEYLTVEVYSLMEEISSQYDDGDFEE